MVGYDVLQAIENSVFSACSDRGSVAESERLHYVFSICQQWCISGQSVTSWSGNETANQRVVCWSILNVWTWYNVYDMYLFGEVLWFWIVLSLKYWVLIWYKTNKICWLIWYFTAQTGIMVMSRNKTGGGERYVAVTFGFSVNLEREVFHSLFQNYRVSHDAFYFITIVS